MPKLQFLHFNDVYHLAPQKREPVGGAARFATVIKEFRESYGVESSCVFFSGDAFNPSVESSVSKGAHMVPALNAFGIDAACLGNHDFDFGVPTLKELVAISNFPWLLSNVVDSETDEPMAGSKKFVILEKNGLKLGIVGLVEKDWLDTIPNLPPNLKHKDYVSAGKELIAQLRDPNGPYAVDLIIALTHCRLPNDIILANKCKDDIDLILGGHDHFYYIGKGCDVINGWSREAEGNDGWTGKDAVGDDGVRLVKSGTDFRELSIVELDIDENTNEGRTLKRIKNITVTRREVTSSIVEDEYLSGLIDSATSDIKDKMSKPIAYTVKQWDCRSSILRTQETAFGNFIADLLYYAYKPCITHNIDCAILCAGTIRSDSIYDGEITLGDLLEIFPFEDTVVVIRVTGRQLWDVLQSAVSMVPKQEGRFPVVSGLKIEYNQNAVPGDRLRNVWLTERQIDDEDEDENISDDPGPHRIVGKLDMQKTYTVCTRAYLASGNDGYKAFAEPTTQYLVDHENGVILSTLIRRYFIGLYYINAIKFNMSCEARTKEAVIKAANSWKKLAESKREKSAYGNISSRRISSALSLSMGEHVKVQEEEEATSTLNPVVDTKKVEFVKDWVTVAPMIEGRIVTVDF
ncbi:Metallo-dependent phosphatase [Gigaspora margarita]|uniref:Metallo-dependent phosphatase n=1 Tax=Gigaspora margarita TaxID=4874 RepID=A0A8H3XF17_GIGMA|nr:Metallo-dependent phosphatase [Gigaspora margarita]